MCSKNRYGSHHWELRWSSGPNKLTAHRLNQETKSYFVAAYSHSDHTTRTATETEDLDAQRPAGSDTSGTVFLHDKTNEHATANHKKTIWPVGRTNGNEGPKSTNPKTELWPATRSKLMAAASKPSRRTRTRRWKRVTVAEIQRETKNSSRTQIHHWENWVRDRTTPRRTKSDP
jgi:hypothetical protein